MTVPSTPPRHSVRHHAAATPKRGVKSSKIIHFHQNHIGFEANNSLDFLKKHGIDVKFYRTPSGQLHSLVAQTSNKACGPTCLMMLYLDKLLASANPEKECEAILKDEESIFTYYLKSLGLTNAVGLVNHAPYPMQVIVYGTESSLTADEHERFEGCTKVVVKDRSDLVSHLKKALQDGPIIQAITHPEIEGHWIVIDAFKDGNFYVRDPFSGAAYEIPENMLSKWLLKGVKIEFALHQK